MLQVWLDGLVLLVEEREIWYDVLDDVRVGEGVDLGFLLGVCRDSACRKVSSFSAVSICPEA